MNTVSLIAILVALALWLVWEQVGQTPDMVWNVYSTTNAAQPMGEWKLTATVSNKTFGIEPTEAAQFFTVTASNSAGESGFATK